MSEGQVNVYNKIIPRSQVGKMYYSILFVLSC